MEWRSRFYLHTGRRWTTIWRIHWKLLVESTEGSRYFWRRWRCLIYGTIRNGGTCRIFTNIFPHRLATLYYVIRPHQSAEALQWPPHQFYSGLQCLRSKIGFPRGEQMLCPVFTQNKGLYLLLANQYCNPTLIIDLEDWRNQAGKDDAFFQKKGLISR